MNAVGIDVSKGNSMVALVRPFGELVTKPLMRLYIKQHKISMYIIFYT